MALTHAVLLALVAMLGAEEATPKAAEATPKASEAKPAAPAFQVQIDPKAEEVMRSLHTLFDKATRFSVTAHVVRRREVGEQKDLTELTQQIYMEEPNHVTVAHVSGPALPSIYCDGQVMFLYDVGRNIYSRHDPPQTLKDFYTSRRLGAIAMGAAFLGPVIVRYDDPDRMAGVLAMVYAGTETVNGQECHKLKILNTSAPLIYWIATGPSPLLCKVALDSESALLNLRKEKPGAQNLAFEASVTYDNWSIGKEFTGEPFTFRAPAGSTEVSSVLRAETDGSRHKRAPLPKATKSDKKSKAKEKASKKDKG